jgi:hypothetical protein
MTEERFRENFSVKTVLENNFTASFVLKHSWPVGARSGNTVTHGVNDIIIKQTCWKTVALR